MYGFLMATSDCIYKSLVGVYRCAGPAQIFHRSAYDKYHAKGGKRGYADGKFANPTERKAAKKAEQEEKRAAKEAMDEVLQSKEPCRWAKKGRCKRGFPTSEMGCKFLHGEPHTYKDIKCASNLFRECYFTPATCPYLDHKDTLDEQIGNSPIQ